MAKLSYPCGDVGISFSSTMNRSLDSDEFTALDSYVSSLNDAREPSTTGERDGELLQHNRIPWWSPRRHIRKLCKKRDGSEHSDGDKTFHIPEAWLKTNVHDGLGKSDVELRRKKIGWNELAATRENMFLRFLTYFRGPILYVMEIAAVLAAGLRDWIGFGVIIGILMLNATVGWYQEKQASDVVATLKGDITMKALVIRDRKEQEIQARELVPGDIVGISRLASCSYTDQGQVILEEGSNVPGEARLICAYDDPDGLENFKKIQDPLANHISIEKVAEGGDTGGKESVSIIAIDQSTMTGESLAVDKYMGDICYYTTGCKRGKGLAIVTTSAKYSLAGKIAKLVQVVQDQGHFKGIMNQIGTTLLVLVVFWILCVWIGGFFHHLKIATSASGSQSLLNFSLVLLIIGVPVGLPVVTTTTLAVGAAYLAKEKAIVQHLTAIESLAGVDVLCSDKTGTLTANKLNIREPFLMEGVDINWMMAVAVLASSHNVRSLDPIDKVTISALQRYPTAREILRRGWKTEKYSPFDPVSKRITTVVTLNGTRYTAAKGAPKAILKLTSPSEAVARMYHAKSIEFAKKGFRSLGVAVQQQGHDWELLGMYPMFDPPRDDTAQTITDARNLGLSVKMLTGDAIAVAKETCKMLALGSKVYNSEKLIHGDLTGSALHDFVEKADGFAEVFPEHKYQVVEMLQQRGHLIAMTGDGVNDAPSLRKADCGIAVEGATEAAQSAADIVFLSPGLSTIIKSIKVARQTFQRMKSYIQYRIALCLHLEIYLSTSMIIINEAIQPDLVVFLALFADLATIAVAYDRAHVELRPVEWQLPRIWAVSILLGVLLATGTWVIRGTLYLPSGGIIQNFGSVQEILFLEIALTQNWLIFVTRGGKTRPSFQLVGAIFCVDAIATLFSLFGWLSGPAEISDPKDHTKFSSNGWVDIVTVVVIWLYSICVIIVIALTYHVLTNVSWFDNLGRTSRSKADTMIENTLVHLSKLAIEHATEPYGNDVYRLTTRTAIAEEEEEEEEKKEEAATKR